MHNIAPYEGFVVVFNSSLSILSGEKQSILHLATLLIHTIFLAQQISSKATKTVWQRFLEEFPAVASLYLWEIAAGG